MNESVFAYIARHRKALGADGIFVFMGMIKHMSVDGGIRINSSDLAKNLSMRMSDVNRAIERLIRIGLIIRGEKVNRDRIYKLNSYLNKKEFYRSYNISRGGKNSSIGASHLTLVTNSQ